MTDPVSELLERRSATPWRWRPAVVMALVLHVGVVAVALLSPAPKGRALTLPRVQVRIAAAPALQPAASAPARAPAQEVAAPKPAPPAAKPAAKPRKDTPKPVARKSTSRTAKPAPTTVPTAVAAGDGGTETAAEGSRVSSPAGGIGLGGGASGTDEAFPYAYYLNRVLATIEGNWFRPPVPPETRCRVLCRIDRAGALVQVGIEVPSGAPAFDRAALRSVYASTPFPPLPQGYGGSTLTLHLEFGSK